MEMFRKRQADLAAKAAQAEQKKGAEQTGAAPAAAAPNATAQQKKPAAPATP
jgi:hypothetical protein